MASLSSLVPDVGELQFTAWDYAGLAVFVVCTLAYHGFYAVWTRRHPLETVKGKVALYRRTWVKRILDRDEQMLAVQSVRNLLMTSSFMASSALLVTAVVLNYLLVQAGGNIEARLSFQLLLLVAVYGYGFFSFLLSVRHLNHFSILVGADKDLIGSVEPVDAVTFLANILNHAGNRFTMGQRAFYFSLPVVAWVVDARAFLLLTLAIFVYLAVFLDFKKWKPAFPLRARTPREEPPGAAPAAAPRPSEAVPSGGGAPERRGPG